MFLLTKLLLLPSRTHEHALFVQATHRFWSYSWCSHVLKKLTMGTHTHTHLFHGPLSGTTRVSRCQKGKTNLDFTETRDSEWQWHQLGHMQVCTSLQKNDHDSTPSLCFLLAGCPYCCPTNSVKALKAVNYGDNRSQFLNMPDILPLAQPNH